MGYLSDFVFMMSSKNIFQTPFIVFLLVVGSLCLVLGQEERKQISCEDENLKVYADSLWQLMVGYQPKKVVQIADSLLKYNDRLICPEIIRIRAHRAYAYERLFKYDTALEIYNELLKIVEDRHFIEEEVYIKISLARLYETIGRPQLCEEYLTDIERLFQDYENKSHQSHYYVRVASYHRIYKDREVAREYAQRAIDLGEESGRLGSLAGGHMILGGLTQNISEKTEHFQKSAQYCYEEGDYAGFLLLNLNIASIYVDKKDYNKALDILESIKEDVENLLEEGKIYYQVKSYQSTVRSRIYQGTGQKDSLITALKEIHQYSTLFGNVTNEEKINQLILDNAVEKEKEKVDYEKRRSRFLSFGLIGLFGFTLLLLRFYFTDKRKNRQIKAQSSTISQQYNELQKLYNYQSTLLSEVHHRIKNNLQLIMSLLTLQKAKLGNEIEDGVLDMLSYRISSISLIHEQLYNLKEFENVDVGLYVRDLIKNFKSLLVDKNVNILYETDDISLNLETIIPLGLIWSELISNSLKYNLNNPALKIQFELLEEAGGIFTMKYHDNGVGYPEGHFQANNKGMGYIIIDSLSRQLSSETNAFNNNGAHFNMKFKQKKISPL